MRIWTTSKLQQGSVPEIVIVASIVDDVALGLIREDLRIDTLHVGCVQEKDCAKKVQ